MGGHALSHKRAEHFLIPPKNLLIVGFDTKHVSGEHPLWRADCKNPANESLVASVRRHGIIQPIRARKLPKTDIIDSDHLSLSNEEYAEVVVGRERVKAARVIESEGTTITVPCLLWPAGTSLGEIIGVANAENYQRKTESSLDIAEHVYLQLRAEGFFDGAEADALKSVAVSTGMSVQRLRNLLAFREDDRLVRAFRSGKVKGEALLAIATLPEDKRATALQEIIDNPSLATVAQVRERIGHMKANGKVVVHNGVAPEKLSGVSKALQRRIVDDQAARVPDARDLDPLVLKTLRVCAGLAAPSTVPGFSKALKALGL